MEGSDDFREDPVEGAPVLAREDRTERLALLVAHARVEYRLRGPVALVQRSRPVVCEGPPGVVERHVAEVTAFDDHRGHALAFVMGGIGVEVTRTARVAVAVLHVRTFHEPVAHRRQPQW